MNEHHHYLSSSTLGKLKLSSISSDIVQLQSEYGDMYYDIDTFSPNLVDNVTKKPIKVKIRWKQEDLYLSLSELLIYAPKHLYKSLNYPLEKLIHIPSYITFERRPTKYRNIR